VPCNHDTTRRAGTLVNGTDRVTLLEPLAVIDGRKAIFLRDNFGGEVPLSCPYPPLELLYTAGLLRQAGIPVELIAANVLGMEHDAVIARLQRNPPAWILIPSAWGSLVDDLRLIQLLKNAMPATRVAISGPNVTADPERPLREAGADAVILGEPEEAMLALAKGTPIGALANVAYLDGATIVSGERRLPAGWPEYPLPARDLIDLGRYLIPFSSRLPSTTMATVRGCPKKCTFCPTQIWNQRVVRARPIDLVMDEIDELIGRYGVREVAIRDDTFTWDRERVLAFCDAMRQRGRARALTWRCFATVDTVDASLLNAMAAAGCVQVCYGFESADEAVLQKCGKQTTVAQGVDAVRWTKAAGIEVSGTFIVGLEGDTPATIRKSIEFAKANDLDYLQVNVAVPLPSTGFGKRQARAGRHASPEVFRWFGKRTGETAEIAADDLPAYARRFYREFYLRPAYIAGRLTSRRGARALWNHVKLGARMARHVLPARAPAR
jgi:anaerobic magnesium-protoporphyrin IX monomethyl ester cyclase